MCTKSTWWVINTTHSEPIFKWTKSIFFTQDFKLCCIGIYFQSSLSRLLVEVIHIILMLMYTILILRDDNLKLRVFIIAYVSNSHTNPLDRTNYRKCYDCILLCDIYIVYVHSMWWMTKRQNTHSSSLFIGTLLIITNALQIWNLRVFGSGCVFFPMLRRRSAPIRPNPVGLHATDGYRVPRRNICCCGWGLYILHFVETLFCFASSFRFAGSHFRTRGQSTTWIFGRRCADHRIGTMMDSNVWGRLSLFAAGAISIVGVIYGAGRWNAGGLLACGSEWRT